MCKYLIIHEGISAMRIPQKYNQLQEIILTDSKHFKDLYIII